MQSINTKETQTYTSLQHTLSGLSFCEAVSSSFSDNLNSQLDSDRFSVKYFIMEVEDDAPQPPTDSPTQSEEQWNSLQPYQDEPIADPAWIAQYNEVRQGEEERTQLLLNRLNGVVHVSDWYVKT